MNNILFLIMARLYRMFSPRTLLRKMARRIWTDNPVAPSLKVDSSVEITKQLLTCDILVQVDNFETGGLENVVIDLNEIFMQAGYRVILLVLGNQGAAIDKARDRGQVIICSTYSDSTYAALLDQLQPKLLLAHYSIQGIRICQQRSVPVVHVIHNIYMWFNNIQRCEFSKAATITTAFVAVSDIVKNYSISRLGVMPKKCTVIKNGIDLNPYLFEDRKSLRTRLRTKHNIAEEEFIFLDVGAITHQKNHLGMIKAFEIAVQTCKNSYLIILGTCYEQTLLEEMLAYARKQELQDKVFYFGAVTNVAEYFAMADAFVSASFFEGGQLVFLEAIAANIPIVTSAVGFCADFPERQGIRLVEPAYDMECFNGAIQELKSTQEFEQRLAEAMIRTWENPKCPDFSEAELATFEKGRAYEKYLCLIDHLITRKGGFFERTQ